MIQKETKLEVEEIEIRLLLEGIFQRYGYDFRDYAPSSIKRRILKCMGDERLDTISGLLEKMLHDPECFGRLLKTISVDITALFRDPVFYLAFRRQVVPFLHTCPFVRIWHAGCATGEEAYSMAILLKEEGLYGKARLYATDMNDALIRKAKEGIFPLDRMKENSRNYLEAGGKRSLSDYYLAKYDHALFDPSLRQNMIWANHNLVTDASFNEFDVVFCRNVMIYFNSSLQNRVHDLLYESLALSGILVLGAKESLRFTGHETDYEAMDEVWKIYRKAR